MDQVSLENIAEKLAATFAQVKSATGNHVEQVGPCPANVVPQHHHSSGSLAGQCNSQNDPA